jgi:1-acyl-sn-glycerol-3-phosphate acyltransferase
VFGVCTLLFNLLCALLLLLPGRRRLEGFTRAVIHRFFSTWIAGLNALGVLRVRWHCFDTVPLRRPAVWVANHPGLLDATFLFAQVPDAVCIFKPALLRNPFIAPAAIMAGSVAGDMGPEFVHDSLAKLAAGRSLLIFPEGTRTAADATLNPFKPGFALIAERARVPVQVVVIRADRDLLPRGRPWWHVPRLPAKVDLHVDCTVTADPARSVRETAALVEKRLVSLLSQPAQPAAA